jgi:2-aminoethylphosphonate-pyruvate transaminase
MQAILLNPGPVTLSEGVRKAAVSADLCHREPEFFDLQERVRAGLLQVYDCDPDVWSTVLLGGSGTTALEAMISSLAPPDSGLLVLENGVYGERLSHIAAIHGIDSRAVRHEWSEHWNMNRVAEMLAADEITHVAAVHHETTTGRLNPVAGLADLCTQHGKQLMLDSVSSFGAEPTPFESPALIACAATANKCLHGITGLCLVMCRKNALEGAPDPPRSLTLHLPLWARNQDRRSTPFTPSVNAILALDQALRELDKQGGWRGRHARYRKLAGMVANKLADYGVDAILPEQDSSCVLRSYRLPGGSSYEQVHDALKQHGFVIYAGQGSLETEMFRISTMGDISNYDMNRLLAALEATFQANRPSE